MVHGVDDSYNKYPSPTTRALGQSKIVINLHGLQSMKKLRDNGFN